MQEPRVGVEGGVLESAEEPRDGVEGRGGRRSGRGWLIEEEVLVVDWGLERIGIGI